jgi:lycopene beta-cyclase
MDFSVEQKAIPFMYANFNHRSFIEYTLFSPAFWREQEIKQYIENLGIQNFEIIEKRKYSHDLLSFLEQNYQASWI